MQKYHSTHPTKQHTLVTHLTKTRLMLQHALAQWFTTSGPQDHIQPMMNPDMAHDIQQEK